MTTYRLHPRDNVPRSAGELVGLSVFSTRVDGEVLAIAQRGGMGDERENTRAAFLRTVAVGSLPRD